MSKICRQPSAKPVNSPHLTPWRKDTRMMGSMLSTVMLPPLGMVNSLRPCSTVASAIIRAHSTRMRVLE